MARSPRMPFPSFMLALSRQEAGENESTIQERTRNASNVEPLVDLMVLTAPVYFFFFGFSYSLSLLDRKHSILAYHATIVVGIWYVFVLWSDWSHPSTMLTLILSVIQWTKIGLTQRLSSRNELTSWRLVVAREASMEAEKETEDW